jgi:cell division septal protein FtsQ
MPTQLKEKSREKKVNKKIDPRIKARIEKVRKEKAAKRKKRLIVAATIISPIVIALGVLSSPLTSVKHVKVLGALNSDQIKTVLISADLQYHPQMALVFSGQLAQKLEKISWAKVVRVEKKWPDTINIYVEPRIAVSYIVLRGTYYEVDVSGRLIYLLAQKPDLPQLLITPGPYGLGGYINRQYLGALYVASSLPSYIRGQTQSIGISDSILLNLRGSLTAKLGDASQISEKMTDLSAILKFKRPASGSTIDVAVPQYPVVTSS